MDTKQYNQLFSFIWNIANDVLVNNINKGDYRKVILPFIVLRRIDVLLEPTKKQVLEKKAQCEKMGLTNIDVFMTKETGYPFYNTSIFTLRSLRNETDPSRLKMNMIDYFNGYSQDVQDIIEKFHLRQWVDNLTEVNCLGAIVDKFTDERINLSSKPVLDKNGKEILPALDNHTMGTIFEELLRKFNEENNVTDAGEHYTPRDYVHLLAQLAVAPIADKLKDGRYTIYDGACGTGGMLTIAQEEIQHIAEKSGKRISTSIFGQECIAETYATCKADLMISGNIQSFRYQLDGKEHEYIAFGSTISADGHANETFDFCISNPPFGTPWKKDLQALGIDEKKKKDFVDPRFCRPYAGDANFNFLPDIGDCQMLFLANNLSRMKDTELGTRIVEVHNGSSLFTGGAGSGSSNLRRYIIENDLLEAIIAMPENDFYNTGIGTYVWILSNRKEERRRGLVQLIDATDIKTPLRKNLGEKNCETNEQNRAQILKLYMDFKETPQSKIFPNDEFAYWWVKVLHSQRDENGNVVLDKKGNPIPDKSIKDEEQIPFRYEGGIQGFFENEIKPYSPDAWIDEKSITIGYELSFTKYFFKPTQLSSLANIDAKLRDIEKDINGKIEEITNVIIRGLNPNAPMKESGISWIGKIPAHWKVKRFAAICKQKSICNCENEELLSVYLDRGVIKFSEDDSRRTNPTSKDLSNYQLVEYGDFVLNNQQAWRGSVGVSKHRGIVSPAYFIFELSSDLDTDFANYMFRSRNYVAYYHICSKGVGSIQRNLDWGQLKQKMVFLPPIEEQRAIVRFIDAQCTQIDTLIGNLDAEISSLKECKQRLIADAVTGAINVQE